MNKHIISSLVLVLAALMLGACNDSESDLLKPKVYFDSKEHRVTVGNVGSSMQVDLAARVSNLLDKQVEVSYSIGDVTKVDEYNARYGTNFEAFDPADAKIDNPTAKIESRQLYADKTRLTLNNLDKLAEGKSYLLPICLRSASLPTIDGSDIQYIVLAKPVTITMVGTFSSDYISVKFPSGTFFKSFTYEALIYASSFGSNNTIMGTEGVMILRIGDVGGGIQSGILQIAGRQHYESPDKLPSGKWCHVALTYDQPTGKTVMYLNGEKWAESAWGIAGFDPNADVGFNIGKLAGFPWGERPFYGYMSEIRVWGVARSENQIKQNMLGVDPKSDGLELYYKLNGSEEQANGIIKDSAKGLDGKTNGITIHRLDEPIKIQ